MDEYLPPYLDKYRIAFDKHTEHVDDLAKTLLSGHLVLEQALGNVIDAIFLRPDHVHSARLSFTQKVAIVRAYCDIEEIEMIWPLLKGINSVRNEIAHKLGSEGRSLKMDQLRQMSLGTVSAAKKRGIQERYGCGRG